MSRDDTLDSSALQSSDVLVSNDATGLLCVPREVLEMITGFVDGRDLNSLSQTCRMLYAFLNDNEFWIRRIRCQFPQPVAQLYTCDLFQRSETIPSYDDIRPAGFLFSEARDQLDQLAIESATHYNDEAIEKRQVKMYVSQEDFSNDVEYFQFKKTENCKAVPIMKAVYFYLIDRKRLAAVDMEIFRDEQISVVEENDENSLTGRIIHFRTGCSFSITGRFEHKIMPGKYEVSWTMRRDLDDMDIWEAIEFIVVPQHGRLLDFYMSQRSFQDLQREHENCWFTVKMGRIIIYEPSQVLVAIRNWHSLSSNFGLSWDCVELALIS